MPYHLNGQPVSGPFVLNDTRYSGQELALWSREDLEAIGLEWVEPVVPVVSLADLKAEAKDQVRSNATTSIYALWPQWKQINAALGIYGAEAAAECAAFIQEVRARTDVLDARIEAASDAESLSAIDLTV